MSNSLLRSDLAALTEQLACVQAEHSLDKAALDEARELLAIAEVNNAALLREKDELLVKLQGLERSYDKLRTRLEETVRQIGHGV
jgi:chromosome segregation ATPase